MFEPHIFGRGWDCWPCLEEELSTENGGGGESPIQLTMGRLNAKCLQSSGWRGMEKKQSFKSMTNLTYPLGIATGEGSPGCRIPMETIVLSIALRSCNSRHLPFCFRVTNMGVFQGNIEGSICPAASCSCTNSMAADNFLAGRDLIHLLCRGSNGPYEKWVL